MKDFVTRTALAAAVALCAAPAPGEERKDQPFGFVFGKPISEYRCKAQVGPISVCSAPNPSKRFDIYTIVSLEKYGVCAIRAGSTMYSRGVHDPTGRRLKAKIDSLAEGLAAVYGPMSKYDDQPDYVEKSPEFWMKSIQTGDGVYGYVWDSESGAALPESIGLISLQAQAVSVVSGFPVAIFNGRNADECLKEVDAAAKR